MAECFCGCGQKVTFLDRNLNSQGRHTVDLVDKLEAAQGRLEQGPWVEGDKAGAMALVQKWVEEGNLYSDLFRRAVHREPLPTPRKANTLRREWGAWRKKANGLADLLALPNDEAIAAFHAYAKEPAAGAMPMAAQPQAPPGTIEVGPWFFAPEYQSVQYMDEADDPPRAGLFVFVNQRMVSDEAMAAADEHAAEISREVVASDLDLADQVEAAANFPLDSAQMQAAVNAALNNPANWVSQGNDDNARPDDEYVCMELDPKTGQVLLSGD